MRLDDTNIVVPVAEQSQRDRTKRFPETEIDWAIVDAQLESKGKKLRANLSSIMSAWWLVD